MRPLPCQTGPMPFFNLHQDDETFKALAPFQVLAVMCHPNSPLSRERMLADIQRGTGQGKPRRRPFSSEEFRAEVRRLSPRASVAGGLLLTMIQLDANGYRGSLKSGPASGRCSLAQVATAGRSSLVERLPRWAPPSRPAKHAVSIQGVRECSPSLGGSPSWPAT